jgi:hypothetical protein
MPPYQAKPLSGDAEPKPLPMFFTVSVTLIRARYFVLLNGQDLPTPHGAPPAVATRL